MTVLDTLTLALGVDAKGIDKGLADAQRKMEAGAKSLADTLMSPFKTALGTLAAGLSLGAITRQYLQQADSLGKLADSMGADVEELQAWGGAARSAGGSAEAFNATVQGMTRSLQMAANGAKGPAAQALQQLGVKATDASGKARDTFEVLRDIAGKMEGMDKQQAMGLGQRIGIDRGTIMLLQSGRAAIDDLIVRQKELGVYTKEDAEIAAKANDAIDDLGQALKSGAAIVMRVFVPAIRWVAEKMTAVVQFFKRHQPLVVAGLGAIAAIITARMIPALMKMAAANAKAFAPFLLLAAIIAGVALVVDDFWTYMNGGNSALEDLWKTFGEGPELLAKFKKTWEDVKTTFLDTFKSAKEKALDFFSYFDGVVPPLTTMLEGVGNIVKGLFNWDFKTLGKGVSQALLGAVDVVTEGFSGLWKYITDGADGISWEGLKNGAKKAWENVKQFAIGFFEALPQDAQEKLQRLWSEISNAFKWDNVKERFKEVFNIDLDVISQKIANLFNIDWKGITEKFKKLWDMDWAALKQSILDIFPSWDEIKHEFASIFDVDFDWEKIKNDIIKGFDKAWEWIKANFPPARWLAEFGSGAKEVVKNAGEAIKSIDASEGEALADANVLDMSADDAHKPAPADAVSAQAAAASTINNVDQSMSYTNNGKTEIIVNGAGDPMATANAVKNEIENAQAPRWARQTAGGVVR